jgi:O-methyltransferase
MNKFNIINFGPKETSFDQNNIWVIVESITPNSKIYINDNVLESCINEKDSVITASLPDFIFDIDMDYSFYIYDDFTNYKSNKFVITVNLNKTSSFDDITKLKNENFKLNMELYQISKVPVPTFTGWGMSTYHQNPWDDKYKLNTLRKSLKELKENFLFGLEDSIGISENNIDVLNWRHYIISFCTNYCLSFTSCDDYCFVECGVGDGMSTFVSLKEIVKKTNSFSYHLYDTWSKMDKSMLVESESFLSNHYDDLDLNRTKENLSEFKLFCNYHQGLIPDVYNEDDRITNVNFLHIDLNSLTATIATLDYFLPKMCSGAIVLFDDYGWAGHEITKDAIDKYFSNSKGIFLKLPTGQALFICNH